MQHGLHRPVVQADEAVAMLSHFEAVQKSQPVFSPAPQQLAQERGSSEIDFFFDGFGNEKRTGGIEVDGVRRFQRNSQRLRCERLDIYTVPSQSFVKIQTIDGT